MKLIIKEYLASLKERDELDAVLPDLLSALGLNVFSRPGRGTRQDGVDVAAVGTLDGKKERVYLFSIKSGDLTRELWDGDALQSLRSSLNEIKDAYIPNRLPNEHKDKDVVICLCFGGDMQEQVRPQVEGYIKQNKKKKLSFEEWNGDKLAALILSNFLREDLLPLNARSQLRKSLALLDEPEASYKHFSILIRSLIRVEDADNTEKIRVMRQINICLWILFAWGREANNIESSYLSSEFALLQAWGIAKAYATKRSKAAKAIQLTFNSILFVYQQISSQYLAKNILPNSAKLHALSNAVQASCHLDVNLKLFDILGRLSLGGIWAHWSALRCDKRKMDIRRKFANTAFICSLAIKKLISNNPTLLLPIKDDQAIDISLALLLLSIDSDNYNDMKIWLSELVNRVTFLYQTDGCYPCALHSYTELLEHPKHGNEAYRREVTSGSILFPAIALWSVLLGDEDSYSKIKSIKENFLNHCNFQFWYPDETSEEYFYTNNEAHGATLSHVCIDRSSDEFINQAFTECAHSSQFKNLSAIKHNLWPLILVACRHYRVPIPLHLMEGFRKPKQA